MYHADNKQLEPSDQDSLTLSPDEHEENLDFVKIDCLSSLNVAIKDEKINSSFLVMKHFLISFLKK